MICRAVLGVVFIWAAAAKVPELESFADSVGNYRILPAILLNPLAVWLVGIELAAGAAVLVGFFSRGAGLVLALLNFTFIGAIASALARGLAIECGCWGPGGGELVSVELIARDLGLLGGSVLVWATREDPLCIERLVSRRR